MSATTFNAQQSEAFKYLLTEHPGPVVVYDNDVSFDTVTVEIDGTNYRIDAEGDIQGAVPR